MNFDTIFERVIGTDAGYTNQPINRANWTSGVIGKGECNGTKYGITAMSYPYLNVRDLTFDKARGIYFKDYFCQSQCNQLPVFLQYSYFDLVVTSGVMVAAKTLQRALGVTPDGIIGSETMQAAYAACDMKAETLCAFARVRLEHLTGLSDWDTFGKGWSLRVMRVLGSSISDLQSAVLVS